MTVIRVLFALVIFGLGAWASLALYFGPLASIAGAVVLAIATLVATSSTARRLGSWTPILLWGLLFSTFLWFWNGVEPSNDRKWQGDVALLPYAEIEGDKVTIHNVRNFEYWTELDYTAHYYTKTYDLNELDEVDLIAVYWMGDAIAHIMVSFGFAGRDYVTMSIETRKEEGESYDTIRGFFKQYELTYIVGDERDPIRLRTNFRKNPPEDVFLYRTGISKENARRLFLDYLRQVNELKNHPEFYNTATTNCTTNIYRHTLVNPGDHSFSWKILLSGYAPDYAYERGVLDSSLPFAELRKRSHINAAAHAADKAPDFSQLIRANLPDPRPHTDTGTTPAPVPALAPDAPASDAAAVEPGAAVVEPGAADAASAEPAPAANAPAPSAPVEPTPAGSAPTPPAPVEPASAGSAPTPPVPAEPTPTESAPAPSPPAEPPPTGSAPAPPAPAEPTSP